MPEFLKYVLWTRSVFVHLKKKHTLLYILNWYCLYLLKLREILDLFQGPDQMSPLLSSPVPPGTVLLWHFVQLSISMWARLYHRQLLMYPPAHLLTSLEHTPCVSYYSKWKIFDQLMTPWKTTCRGWRSRDEFMPRLKLICHYRFFILAFTFSFY